jgi:uncharacterized protein (DUF488 family)
LKTFQNYHDTHDVEAYRQEYKELVLDRLDPLQVLQDIGDDAVLICYETPSQFCHRRLIADWLFRAAQVWIPELDETMISDLCI